VNQENSSSQIREIGIVLGFALLIAIPFLGQAWTIDEPFFLAVGRHILKDPLHPFDFSFNWYGTKELYARINNTPPLFHYLLALAIKLTGGAEFPMRAVFLPFDLLSAFFLYLLAARFLKRPLLPTLIVMACPAYLINMPHLMPEKIMAPFSFLCLYALVRGLDDDESQWYWISAASLAFALLSKYAAIFLLLPAVGYSIERGAPLKRITAYLMIALSGFSLYFLYDHLAHRAALNAAASVFSSLVASYPQVMTPLYKMRSFLSFTGGLEAAACLWPLVLFFRQPKTIVIVSILAAALFLPQLDPIWQTQSLTHIRHLDRFIGFLFSAGAIGSFWALFSSRETRGWPLWASWALSVGLIQIVLYWGTVARLILFVLPPLIFAMAEKLETTLNQRNFKRCMIFSLIISFFLSFSLARVDAAYANSQRRFASWVKTRYIDHGKKVSFTGHWGFQYYFEQVGVHGVEIGSQKLLPGDIFVSSHVNTNQLLPRLKSQNHVKIIDRIRVECPIPLRLMLPFDSRARAGFYASLWGFLPYTISLEPLDEFLVVKIQ
jgi:4-amino-4-deoxy-L-arabinose transferase-like glycosyltransferase